MSDEEEFAKLDRLSNMLTAVIKKVYAPSTPKDYLTLSGALAGVLADFLREAGQDPVEFLKECIDIKENIT